MLSQNDLKHVELYSTLHIDIFAVPSAESLRT